MRTTSLCFKLGSKASIVIFVCTFMVYGEDPHESAPTNSDPSTAEAALALEMYDQIQEHQAIRLKAISALWARSGVVFVSDKDGETRVEKGEGHLMWRPPHDVAITTGKLGEVFLWIGCNDDRFWYIRKYQDICRASICTNDNFHGAKIGDFVVPVHPLQLINLMGLSPLRERKSEKDVAYGRGFVELEESLTHDVFTMQIYDQYGLQVIRISRDTLLPVSVEYRDIERNLVLVRSTLSDYQPLAGVEPDLQALAVVPTNITITTDIEPGNVVQIDVQNPGTTAPNGLSPNPEMFRFRSACLAMQADVLRVVDSDTDNPSIDMKAVRALEQAGIVTLETGRNVAVIDLLGLDDSKLYELLARFDAMGGIDKVESQGVGDEDGDRSRINSGARNNDVDTE